MTAISFTRRIKSDVKEDIIGRSGRIEVSYRAAMVACMHGTVYSYVAYSMSPFAPA